MPTSNNNQDQYVSQPATTQNGLWPIEAARREPRRGWGPRGLLLKKALDLLSGFLDLGRVLVACG